MSAPARPHYTLDQMYQIEKEMIAHSGWGRPSNDPLPSKGGLDGANSDRSTTSGAGGKGRPAGSLHGGNGNHAGASRYSGGRGRDHETFEVGMKFELAFQAAHQQQPTTNNSAKAQPTGGSVAPTKVVPVPANAVDAMFAGAFDDMMGGMPDFGLGMPPVPYMPTAPQVVQPMQTFYPGQANSDLLGMASLKTSPPPSRTTTNPTTTSGNSASVSALMAGGSVRGGGGGGNTKGAGGGGVVDAAVLEQQFAQQQGGGGGGGNAAATNSKASSGGHPDKGFDVTSLSGLLKK